MSGNAKANFTEVLRIVRNLRATANRNLTESSVDRLDSIIVLLKDAEKVFLSETYVWEQEKQTLAFMEKQRMDHARMLSEAQQQLGHNRMDRAAAAADFHMAAEAAAGPSLYLAIDDPKLPLEDVLPLEDALPLEEVQPLEDVKPPDNLETLLNQAMEDVITSTKPAATKKDVITSPTKFQTALPQFFKFMSEPEPEASSSSSSMPMFGPPPDSSSSMPMCGPPPDSPDTDPEAKMNTMKMKKRRTKRTHMEFTSTVEETEEHNKRAAPVAVAVDCRY